MSASVRTIKLRPPLTDSDVSSLQIGDKVVIEGTIYTARDAAHKRLFELIDANKELPFPLKGQVIYYVGPTPPRPGRAMGSAGPTTSYRMDTYTPRLMELGIKATIGKGPRTPAVIEAMKKFKAVYLVAIGGTGALLGRQVMKSETIAFEDLGTEAIRRLTVRDFPAIVANDVKGRDIFTEAVAKYAVK
ncbi:Fe-S-containing hydro-lyase [Candidatus Bathyarchaeota archaeon]|nr:Fe-S-containing hydro-lyase [Candidatus Bathyarchaeota archaeon]